MMSRNEAAERLLTQISVETQGRNATYLYLRSRLDEALATERRLTVEWVRRAIRPLPHGGMYWTAQDEQRRTLAILDDLATADVDEELQPNEESDGSAFDG